MKRRDFLYSLGWSLPSLLLARNVAADGSGAISAADFVGQFGATGIAIQRAIDEAIKRSIPQVRIPALPDGHAYLVKEPIRNDGKLLLGDASGTLIKKIGIGSCFISGQLPKSQGIPLTADLPPGVQQIPRAQFGDLPLASGSIFILTGESHCHANTPAHLAEFVVVQAIAGENVSLSAPLQYGYRKADGAKLRPSELCGGVGYQNLQIEMDASVIPAGANTRFDNFGIQLDFCQSPQISGIHISNGVAAGVRLLGCIGAHISNYSAFDLGSAEDDDTGASKSGLGGYGYGISERGLNLGLIADGVTTDRVRHLYTTGAEWSDVFKYGMPTNSLIRNSVSKNAKEACFDTHETGTGVTFQNCRGEGGRRTGFQVRSKSVRILSCSVKDVAAAGIWTYGANVHPNAAGDNCQVVDFHCENTNKGLDASTLAYGANINWNEIGAIFDQGSGNQFDNININGCAGPALTVAAEAHGGSYANFTATNIGQKARMAPFAVVVEQSNCGTAATISRLRVSASPGLKGLLKVSDANCHPKLMDIGPLTK